MNPATGTNLPIGGVSGTQGNTFPMFGTGNVIYAQAGYKLKNDLLGKQGTLMPYASLQSANYERLEEQMHVFNLGINWLIQGHGSKISLNYENRPVYKNAVDPNMLIRNGRKGSWVIQYQISI